MEENDKRLDVGTLVYYARVLPKTQVFDVHNLKIRTVSDKYFVGCDTKDHNAFLFPWSDLEEIIFTDRKKAVNMVKEAKKNNKERILTTDCEEES